MKNCFSISLLLNLSVLIIISTGNCVVANMTSRQMPVKVTMEHNLMPC